MVLHTGKVWVLSTFLVVVSFYFLKQALSSVERDNDRIARNIAWSILLSFLAFANFPLNAFALINIPVATLYFRKTPGVVRKIAWAVLIGVILVVGVTLINYEGIKNQIVSVFTHYHPLVGKAKVLHLITSTQVGGAENHLLALAKRLQKGGWDCSVAYLKGRPDLNAEYAAAGISVHPLDLKPWLDVGTARRLVSLIRRERPDILHAHLFPAEGYAAARAVVCTELVKDGRRT